MELLPGIDVRDTLLDRLGALTRQRGWEHLVLAPLVEPDARFFPDRWEPTRAGVRVLVRRLLTYAGIGELGASVELFGEDDRPGRGVHVHAGTQAWFAGIKDGVCQFGVARHRLVDHDALVASLAHEVAHAYREHHGIVLEDDDREEEETDLTTVYLGFGVLALNGTELKRSAAAPGLIYGGLSITHRGAGYLSQQAMAYLVALQASARAASPRERKRLASLLEPNQCACFEAACKELASTPGLVAVKLGIPPREEWPPAPTLRFEPIEDDAPPSSIEPSSASPDSFRSRPVVFLVPVQRTAVRIAWACVGAFVLLAIAKRVGDDPSSFTLAVVGIIGALAGYVAIVVKQQRLPGYECSDTDCRTEMVLGAQRCPSCDGRIEGVLRHSMDRLEAEDEVVKERGRSIDRAEPHLVARPVGKRASAPRRARPYR